MKEEKYIKSPLNYVGGKYKLLKEILPLFPKNICTFVDLFGGGFNVGINIDSEQIVYNDLEKHVVDLMRYLNNSDTSVLLTEVDSLIEKYNLSKENAEGFNKLRNYYNEENNCPIVFYTMICYAFNYQIRFNQNGKYNMPFGKAKSSFNPTLRQKFIDFVEVLHRKNCTFCNLTFNEFDFSNLGSDDFVYCDPPYFNSVAAYNEQGGWTEEHEHTLLNILDRLNEMGIRFALSNNLKYKNPLLDEWKDKYNVHYLNGNYSNCNYQKKDKSKDIEVLITNY
ncbi:MAG: DNA adenine methylase [Lachnospiraceae bacterium]